MAEIPRHRQLVYLIAQKASVGLSAEEELKELDAIVAGAEHLRAPKGELEEARAELGAWLVANPGSTHFIDELDEHHGGEWRVQLFRAGSGRRALEFAKTEAAAIRAALSRARGEGT